MKKIMFFASLLFLSANTFAQTAKQVNLTKDNAGTDGIAWVSTNVDLGAVPKDIPAQAQFELRNDGDTPLILTKVKASCGCTTSNYTKEPILPGESTVITANYNAKKTGPFNKTVKVTTNRSKEPIVLRLKGIVNADKTVKKLTTKQ
ncbi:MAG: DUF1573 domain-containing protein [Saprospiraceae bacterium]